MKENKDKFRTSKDLLGVPDPAKTFDALSANGTKTGNRKP